MSRYIKEIIFITLFVLLFTTGVLLIRAVNNRGAVPFIHLKLDEGYGTTAYDASGSNDGTVSGGATWQNEENCKSGKCLYFDGIDDYVAIPDFDLE